MEPKKLFKWREALKADVELKRTTKHILAFLSFYMNEDGASCFPSHRTLAKETGLSRRSVYGHLKIAEKEGWILRTERGFGGQGWKRHSYKVNIPEKVGKEVPHVIGKGGESDDIKVGQGVPLSTSMNTSYNTVPEKNLEKPKSNKPGNSKKRKSEAKIQNSATATEIYEFYIKEIAPQNKNRQGALYNISKHLKRYSKDDLITAIMNYKPEAQKREPDYRKTPSNFFGTKIGNEYFMDYLPGEFEGQKADELKTAQHPQQKEITMDNIDKLYEN